VSERGREGERNGASERTLRESASDRRRKRDREREKGRERGRETSTEGAFMIETNSGLAYTICDLKGSSALALKITNEDSAKQKNLTR